MIKLVSSGAISNRSKVQKYPVFVPRKFRQTPQKPNLPTCGTNCFATEKEFNSFILILSMWTMIFFSKVDRPPKMDLNKIIFWYIFGIV